MTFIEIAVSEGPGTLVRHCLCPAETAASVVAIGVYEGYSFICETLTEQEAKEWRDIHGGWVAV